MFRILLFLFLLFPSLAFSQDLLPCRCSVADVKRAADERGWSYPPQWVIQADGKVVGEMFNIDAAARAMYSPELLVVAKCVAAIPVASPLSTVTALETAVKVCRDQATAVVKKVDDARKTP